MSPILLLFVILLRKFGNGAEFEIPREPKIGPKGVPHNKTTSCSTFGKYARFNIHSVVGHTWFVFYYWDHHQPTTLYLFWVPSLQDKKYIYYLFENRVEKNFNWSSPMLLMKDFDNRMSLLVERGDRGQYLRYKIPDAPLGSPLKPEEMRLKQIMKDKYIGMIFCKERKAYIMSRIKDVPSSEKLKEEASKLGYVGRKGKSYLYQGHEWMPIPELDQNEYWASFRQRIHGLA